MVKKVLVKLLSWIKLIVWQDRRISSRCDELKIAVMRIN